MEQFINLLRHEILAEDLKGFKNITSDKPVVVKQLLARLRNHEPYLSFLLEAKTNWYFDNSGQIPTACVTKDGNKLGLVIGPDCINCNISQMAFVIYHELSHFLKGHTNYNINMGKANHKVANICEDSIINDEILNGKTWAGITLAVPFPIVTLHIPKMNGMDMLWLEGPLYANTKYEGVETSAAVYKWYIDHIDKINENRKKHGGEPQGENQQQQQQQGNKGQQQQQGGGSGQPQFPKAGDIVYNNKTGKYGKVVEYTQEGRKVNKIVPLDKATAEKMAMEQQE